MLRTEINLSAVFRNKVRMRFLFIIIFAVMENAIELIAGFLLSLLSSSVYDLLVQFLKK